MLRVFWTIAYDSVATPDRFRFVALTAAENRVVAESVPCTIVDDRVVSPEIVALSGTYKVLIDACPDAVIFVNIPLDPVIFAVAIIAPCTSRAAVGAVVFPIAS